MNLILRMYFIGLRRPLDYCRRIVTSSFLLLEMTQLCFLVIEMRSSQRSKLDHPLIITKCAIALLLIKVELPTANILFIDFTAIEECYRIQMN